MFSKPSWNAGSEGGVPVAGHSIQQMTRRVQVVYGIYAVATFAYTAYCSYYETGPIGYVMKIELDLFGSADMNWPFIIAMVGWTLTFLLVASIVGKFFPSLIWTHRDAQAKLVMTYPFRPASWKTILWLSAIPGLAAAAIAPGVYVFLEHDQQGQVYTLDLTSGAAALPKDAKFVNVAGVIAKRFVVSFKRVGDDAVVHERYAPITEEGWTPGDPVRYVIAVTARETSDYEVNWPVDFRSGSVTKMSGRIGGSLSTIVESSLRSTGLKLAQSYSVITIENPDHTTTFASEDALLVVGLGVFVSAIFFVALAIGKVARRTQSA